MPSDAGGPYTIDAFGIKRYSIVRPTQAQWNKFSDATRGWYSRQGFSPTEEEFNQIPQSPALKELYKRRDDVRGLLKDYGKPELAEQERGVGRNLAGVDMEAAKRGLYSTTVRHTQRNRTIEAGERERAGLQGQIDLFKTDTEATLTGDIAEQLSNEEDRRQGYAYQAGMGRAQSRAQNRADMFQLAGTLGGGYLSAYRGGVGGGGSGTYNFGSGGQYSTGNPLTRYA
jgi:hypothetical protein